MASRLYYCVVQGWNGQWTVSSFGGRNEREERQFALNGNRRCKLVSRSYDAARSLCDRLSAENRGPDSAA